MIENVDIVVWSDECIVDTLPNNAVSFHFSTERRKYYKHVEKARRNPEQYMSVIIDGMDQSKTFVPHFVRVSKLVSSIWKLRTHVTGAIVHGQGTYAFFDNFEWPHSSNLTINVLLSVLQIHKDSLPPVLYLQLDNCGWENKNRFIFGFLCYLVELGVFKKVKVSFLMVGHTHEDIDQLFSRFSTWLLKHSALTSSKLVAGFEKCFTPTPQGILLDKMFDVSQWISPHLESISMHSKPHVFKITRNSEGRAIILTKKWSTENIWKECEGSAMGNLLKSQPDDCPRLVKPDYEDMSFPKLKHDVESCFKYMVKEEDKQWWRSWFSDMERKLEGKQ